MPPGRLMGPSAKPKSIRANTGYWTVTVAIAKRTATTADTGRSGTSVGGRHMVSTEAQAYNGDLHPQWAQGRGSGLSWKHFSIHMPNEEWEIGSCDPYPINFSRCLFVPPKIVKGRGHIRIALPPPLHSLVPTDMSNTLIAWTDLSQWLLTVTH